MIGLMSEEALTFLLWFLIGAGMMMFLIAMLIAIVAYGYLAWATYRYIHRSLREWYERRRF